MAQDLIKTATVPDQIEVGMDTNKLAAFVRIMKSGAGATVHITADEALEMGGALCDLGQRIKNLEHAIARTERERKRALGTALEEI